MLISFFLVGMKYVLVTGNSFKHETPTLMEVMDESGSTEVCDLKHQYPFDAVYASGVFTDGKMIVCGGFIEEYDNLTSPCYVYGYGEGWTKLADTRVPRVMSASISIPGGILMTGGLTESSDGPKVLQTSEIVYLNGTVRQSKPLPEPRAGHCLVEYQVAW